MQLIVQRIKKSHWSAVVVQQEVERAYGTQATVQEVAEAAEWAVYRPCGLHKAIGFPDSHHQQ